MKIVSSNLSKDVLGSLTVRTSAFLLMINDIVFASEDYDAAILNCQLQVEEFLHREQNAQIADLRKAASEMIQKV